MGVTNMCFVATGGFFTFTTYKLQIFFCLIDQQSEFEVFYELIGWIVEWHVGDASSDTSPM
jgi:hypothetical protein